MTQELYPRLPKDHDMVVEHLGDDLHAVVPKTLDEDREAYLKSKPKGTANAEAQAFGHAVASGALDTVYASGDVNFAIGIVAPSGYNTAWYSGAQAAGPHVQRRRLKYPRFDAPGGVVAPQKFWDDGRQQFRGALKVGDTIARETRDHRPADSDDERRLMQHRVLYMRQLGNACLALVGSQIDPTVTETSARYAQLLARQHGNDLMQASRQIGQVIGRHPSLKQLADPDSHLFVHIRRTAPKVARQAFINAYERRLGAS